MTTLNTSLIERKTVFLGAASPGALNLANASDLQSVLTSSNISLYQQPDGNYELSQNHLLSQQYATWSSAGLDQSQDGPTIGEIPCIIATDPQLPSYVTKYFGSRYPDEVNMNIPWGSGTYTATAADASPGQTYGDYWTQGDVRQIESGIDGAISAGAKNVAAYMTPNLGTEDLVDPFATSAYWAPVRAIALYGGGLALDVPPSFWVERGPAYQAMIRQIVAWGCSQNIRVSLLISPFAVTPDSSGETGSDGYDPNFLANTQALVQDLEAHGLAPTQWCVENYGGTVGYNDSNDISSGDVAGSLNQIALWLATNAPVSPAGTASPQATKGVADDLLEETANTQDGPQNNVVVSSGIGTIGSASDVDNITVQNGSTLDIQGQATNVLIDDGQVIVEATATISGRLDFISQAGEGASELVVKSSKTPLPTVIGFTRGDTIALPNLSLSSASQLSINDDEITITGSGQSYSFVIDGLNNTILQLLHSSTISYLSTSSVTVGDTILTEVPSTAAAVPLQNTGALAIVGATVDTEISNTGVISGFGTLAANVDNDGVLEASGGTLTEMQPVSGALAVDGDSTLALVSGLNGAARITFSGQGGTLSIHEVSATNPIVVSIQPDSTNGVIDLVGVEATGFLTSGGLLMAGNLGSIQAPAGCELAVTSDGRGGTLITATTQPTITFSFALTQASESHDSQGDLVVSGPDGAHIVPSDVTTFVFSDGVLNDASEGPDGLVDPLYYNINNPDVWAAHIDAAQHYEAFGWQEGRNPSAGFDTKDYLAANPDVAAAGMDPLLHYAQFGLAEGRPAYAVPTQGTSDPLVNSAYIYAERPDIRAEGLDAAQWWNTEGWKEGVNPDPYFDTTLYLSLYPDVKASGINPLQHFEAYGWKEGRIPSLLFDDGAYLNAYPDVAASGIDPLLHYMVFGATEGRMAFLPGGSGPVDPGINANFLDAQLGATLIPTGIAAASQASAIYNYDGGWQAGLNPSPNFQTDFYLVNNKDVTVSGINPLLHFETFGSHEGRLAIPESGVVAQSTALTVVQPSELLSQLHLL